jgi:hypothetical protein
MDEHTKSAQSSATKASKEADNAETAAQKNKPEMASEAAEEAASHARAAYGHAHAAHAAATGKKPDAHSKAALGRWDRKLEQHGGQDAFDAHDFSESMITHVAKLAASHGYTPAAQAMEEAAQHHHRANKAWLSASD